MNQRASGWEGAKGEIRVFVCLFPKGVFVSYGDETDIKGREPLTV